MDQVSSYWKEQVEDDVRQIPAIHDGIGTIRVKSFFQGLTTSGVNLHIWELDPGTSEGRHIHPAADPADAFEEIYFVIDGEGVLELGVEDVPLQKGDAVLIPVDVDHGLRAIGEVPLRILLIFARSLPH